jgi:hypothetical protein
MMEEFTPGYTATEQDEVLLRDGMSRVFGPLAAVMPRTLISILNGPVPHAIWDAVEIARGNWTRPFNSVTHAELLRLGLVERDGSMNTAVKDAIKNTVEGELPHIKFYHPITGKPI